MRRIIGIVPNDILASNKSAPHIIPRFMVPKPHSHVELISLASFSFVAIFIGRKSSNAQACASSVALSLFEKDRECTLQEVDSD